MNDRNYRRTWLRYREGYERRGLRTFRKGIRAAVQNIPFDNLDPYHYTLSIEGNLHDDDIKKAFFDFYLEIGLMHGRRVGAGINKQTKFFDPGTFGEAYRKMLQAWMFDNAGLKIVSVRKSLADYLVKYISAKLDENIGMQQIIRDIQKHILTRGFYRYQIERIVRTETTAAANYGASVAGSESGLLLEKKWISGADARVRRHEREDAYDHLDMNGVKVGKDEPFIVQGVGEPDDVLMFPGDPKGRAANVINCRCTVALVPKRDADGNLVFGSESATATRPRRLNVLNIGTPPDVDTSVFTPAKNLAEAEKRIMQLGVKKVSLKGLNKGMYNSVLKAVEKEAKYSKIDLSEIETFRKASSRGRAYYSPSNDKISINLSHISKFQAETITPYPAQRSEIMKALETWKGYVGVDKYDQRKVRLAIVRLEYRIDKIERKIKQGLEAKPWSTSSNTINKEDGLYSTIHHEFGHYRHAKHFGGLDKIPYRFDPLKSPTEYGRTNHKEYLAEWYAYYMRNGEKDVPADLLKLFKSLQK